MPSVLITGASSGIGATTAQLFFDQGWQVAATMRRPDSSALPSDDRVLVTRLDVEDADSVTSAISEAVERFGGLDVVVNNAGFGQYGLFESISEAAVRRQLEVNLFGPMAVMRAALPHLRTTGRGVIVNVGSGAGLYGLPMTSVYCASKFALDGFTEAVAYELRRVGVTAKLVVPHGGVVGTSFGRGGEPSAIAEGYQDYVAATLAAAGGRPAPVPIPAADVAATVFLAATDGTNRLRYIVGNDIRGLLAAVDLPLADREQELRLLLG
jgi:NAD(P)-dependent dehydrogenase (short-subunit alcohol dehydrogenase family)